MQTSTRSRRSSTRASSRSAGRGHSARSATGCSRRSGSSLSSICYAFGARRTPSDSATRSACSLSRRSAHLSESERKLSSMSVPVSRSARTSGPHSTGRRTHDAELGLELAVALEKMWVASRSGGGHAPHRRATRARAGADSDELLRARALRDSAERPTSRASASSPSASGSESLELYRALGDDDGIATVEHRLAVSAWRRGEWERRSGADRGLARACPRRAPSSRSRATGSSGSSACHEGDVDERHRSSRTGAPTWREMSAGRGGSRSARTSCLMLALRQRRPRGGGAPGSRGALPRARAREPPLGAVHPRRARPGLHSLVAIYDTCRPLWGAVESEAGHMPSWVDERSRRAGAAARRTAGPGFLAAVERGTRPRSLGRGRDRAR